MIAHRITSVLDSDMVLVLEQGLIDKYDSSTKLLEDKTSLVAEYSMRSKEKGLVVDVYGFNLAMRDARKRLWNTQNKQYDVSLVMDGNAASALHKRGVATTNDCFKFN
nr:ABC transporter C family member 3-like [Tanacetum cinerariifolium]